jgi:hypothetical protein
MAMNARREALERIGERYDPRVLEPSPPADQTEPWFADDPVARGEVTPGRIVVSPVGTGDVRWEELAGSDPQLGAWCADRWLGPYRRLGQVPRALVPTRLALHRLAERVISPARRQANGKIGLRYTHGGFGTPFFGSDMQVRVAGTKLIVQDSGVERTAPITTLDAAADHVGRQALPAGVELGSEPLEVDPEAAAFLGDWYGFAASVLEELRAEASAAEDATRVQLWPEHFDLAMVLGDVSAGARASYGLSPGDEQHPEPYVYVGPLVEPEPGELWQATGFTGAELAYADLAAAADQRPAALEFLRTRAAALAG